MIDAACCVQAGVRSLGMLLAEPLSRVQEIHALLHALLEYTADDHPDLKGLAAAVNQFEKLQNALDLVLFSPGRYTPGSAACSHGNWPIAERRSHSQAKSA